MARDNRASFLRELDKVTPQLRKAFEQAVQDIRGTAQTIAIEDAIRRAMQSGDVVRGVQDVLTIINLGAEFWAPLDRAIQGAFDAGAMWQLSTLPKKMPNNGGPLIVRFQGRHPRAETWTRRQAAELITEISRDTEVLVREVLLDAVENSRPYRTTALELVGRPTGAGRQGGLVGLHSRQAQAVRAARSQLGALDPAYFNRERRDKRFDRTVAKAIKHGRPLSAADIQKITGRYADRLLQLRGDMIARTEGNMAMNAGRAEAMVQTIESGKVPANAVTKIWDATPGPRTRESHTMLNNVEKPWGEDFISPTTGAALKWAHDPDAPAAETVNCRCSTRFRVDYTKMAV